MQFWWSPKLHISLQNSPSRLKKKTISSNWMCNFGMPRQQICNFDGHQNCILACKTHFPGSQKQFLATEYAILEYQGSQICNFDGHQNCILACKTHFQAPKKQLPETKYAILECQGYQYAILMVTKLHIKIAYLLPWHSKVAHSVARNCFFFEPGRWVLQANMQFWWPLACKNSTFPDSKKTISSKLNMQFWNAKGTKYAILMVTKIAY